MKRVLSLGAGVQSSTVLLMSCRGDLPKLDAAIFADTGWEPKAVYSHLVYLEGEAQKAGIPVLHTSCGRNIYTDTLHAQVGGGTVNEPAPDATEEERATWKKWRWASMPLFVKPPDGGPVGMIRRQCTDEYKIKPIEKELRRFLGEKPRARPKDVLVEKWFGISLDECQRMRDPSFRWQKHYYPLVDLRITRQGCLVWLEERGYPTPPKSACIGCPFHSDNEWRAIKRDPEAWAQAVEVDTAIRHADGKRGSVYLHRSGKPLEEVDLRTDEEKGQRSLFNTDGFGNDCSGMCGV